MMTDEAVSASAGAEWPVVKPVHLVIVGLSAAALALVLALVPGLWVPLRVIILAVGILAAGVAVSLQPKEPRVLAGAALVALISAWGMDGSQIQLWVRGLPQIAPGSDDYPDWDGARLLMYLLVALALAALFLTNLPQIMGQAFRVWHNTLKSQRPAELEAAQERGRKAGWVAARAIVSLLAVLHFVGISCAVMALPAGNREAAWLPSQLWVRYQPYLQFMYLNNAYKFYSPEPGPPTLLWFHVEYDDGSARWVYLPTRETDAKDPLAVEFTRRLSLGNSADQVQFVPGIPEAIRQRRLTAIDIPKHPEMPLDLQYRLPNETSQRYIAEFARHVAQSYPHDKRDISVTGVKVYVVIHNMLEPPMMARQIEPTEKWTYRPYYMGEFTSKGELKDPDDPLLYWLIPRFAWPRGVPFNPLNDTPPGSFSLESGDYIVMDFLDKHAKMKTKRRPQ
jgi:hypothetical protein